MFYPGCLGVPNLVGVLINTYLNTKKLSDVRKGILIFFGKGPPFACVSISLGFSTPYGLENEKVNTKVAHNTWAQVKQSKGEIVSEVIARAVTSREKLDTGRQHITLPVFQPFIYRQSRRLSFRESCCLASHCFLLVRAQKELSS